MYIARDINEQNSWSPFKLAAKAEVIRPLQSKEGIADRLRTVAIAELLARDAFSWGVRQFPEAPQEWLDLWTSFEAIEDRHAQMLLDRMTALGVRAEDRVVSDKLSKLCRTATDPIIFWFLISTAEERGMEAGFLLGKQMHEYDAESAAIFKQIADEEVEHVESANKFLAGYDLEELRARARVLGKGAAAQ